MTAMRAFAGLLLLAGVAFGAPPGPGGPSPLERLRHEIAAREEKAREFRERADGFLGELEGIDRELAALRQSAGALRERERAAEEELNGARAQVESAELELARAEKELETRVVALYIHGRAGSWLAFGDAADLASAMRRSEALAQIAQEDGRLFERQRETFARWLEARRTGEGLVAELEGARVEAAGREEAMRRKQVERRNLAELLRSRSQREEQAAAELREAAGRLAEAIQGLSEGGGGPEAGPGLAPGTVPWPTAGSLRAAYGRQVDPAFGTETLRQGVEIEAAAGAPVTAVAPGRVLFSGWFRGYGQMVILDHGGETVTVSGSLDELRVGAGDRVSAGQVVGTVGETGSLAGPGLYFEIRHQGRPVDPIRWLQSRTAEGTP